MEVSVEAQVYDVELLCVCSIGRGCGMSCARSMTCIEAPWS
jgi:hypothetical protein